MQTIKQILDHYAAKQPDEMFLISPDHEFHFTRGDVQNEANFIKDKLASLEISHGSKVAMLLPNGAWTAMLMLGITYAGRVAVPLNAIAGINSLRYVIDHSDSEVILYDAEFAASLGLNISELFEDNLIQIEVSQVNGPTWPVAEIIEDDIEIEEADPAVLMYTSGTTGQPKGVLLTQKNILAGGRNTAEAHELTSTDCALCVLPLYHINAQMVTVMGPLVSGGAVVFPQKFSTSNFWSLLSKYKCSWFSVVPTIIAYLLEYAEREKLDLTQFDLSNLRFGRSASAPLAPEMHKQFEKVFGVSIVETMGLTETAAQILSNPMPPKTPKYGSPGYAVGNEAKVIDDKGDECPRGVPGELMIRGDNVTSGYYKNPEATADAIEPDGWLHTGDIAYQDEDGYFFITGRIKELIIKGGENIAPREIDEALYEHPSVLEAAGFAIPDERYGQEVMACVALKPNTSGTEEEFIELLKKSLGGFKCPKRIFIMDELPKGPSGKIQRLKLADLTQTLAS